MSNVRSCFYALVVLLAGSVPGNAQVVALGASNTAGFGVGPDKAFPSVIERILRAKGVNVSVTNRGVSGDTTGDMLARLDRAVPSGTRVVIFQPGGNDDTEADRQRGIAAISERLRARGIRIVMVTTALRDAARGNVQMDGIHLTIKGHEVLGQAIAPQVASALGR